MKSQVSHAELFACSFQAQVARNPGAACLTLPILRELAVVDAVDALCPSRHIVSHGRIVGLDQRLVSVDRWSADAVFLDIPPLPQAQCSRTCQPLSVGALSE